jgi:hypothetical protein
MNSRAGARRQSFSSRVRLDAGKWRLRVTRVANEFDTEGRSETNLACFPQGLQPDS